MTVLMLSLAFLGVQSVQAQQNTPTLPSSPTSPPSSSFFNFGINSGSGNTNPTTNTNAGGSGLENPLRFNTLAEFLDAVLNAVILIAFPVLVLFMVYAGFLFISAQGKPDKIAQARTVFIWTLIGALLILGSKALAIAINATVQQLQI